MRCDGLRSADHGSDELSCARAEERRASSRARSLCGQRDEDNARDEPRPQLLQLSRSDERGGRERLKTKTTCAR